MLQTFARFSIHLISSFKEGIIYAIYISWLEVSSQNFLIYFGETRKIVGKLKSLLFFTRKVIPSTNFVFVNSTINDYAKNRHGFKYKQNRQHSVPFLVNVFKFSLEQNNKQSPSKHFKIIMLLLFCFIPTFLNLLNVLRNKLDL